MATFFVIYDPINRLFVRAGNGIRFTYAINYAKHFTSRWSADCFLQKMPDSLMYEIKTIAHQ